ncbi:MAG: HK97 family phage prohead protease, partial [Campylobacterales bacterium]|nr:HK97 family phage prohead protease [Campylobacterales bacterium]
MKLKPQFRDIEFKNFDEEKRTIELSFSSEEPYERWFGIEILDHSPTSVNMERLNNSAPLLFNHDKDVVIGVIEYAKVENKRGHAVVRFGNSAKAKEVFSDVVDGIMKNVSVGYQIDEMKLESESDGVETYRVTKWQPFEISIVSIPADNTVGVGRANDLEHEVRILNKKQKREGKNMPDENNNVDVAAVQTEARNSERTRVREISAIGARHGLSDVAAKAIEDGTTTDEFRAMVLDKIGSRQTTFDSKAGDIGLSEKEIKQYSFSKAMAAAITGDWSKAGFEREASKAVEKMLGKDSRGFYMPHEVLKRDLTTTGASNLVGTTH